MEKKYLNRSNSHKYGYVYITSTRRNLFCTIIDYNDKKVKFSCSYGLVKTDAKKIGYVPSKLLGYLFLNKIKTLKYNKVYVILTGVGSGRAFIINSFRNTDIRVLRIIDTTLCPHNGCRPKKYRRKKFRTKMSSKIKKLLSPGF